MRTQAQIITNLSDMSLLYPEFRTLFQLEMKVMNADFDDIYPDFQPFPEPNYSFNFNEPQADDFLPFADISADDGIPY